MVGFCSEFYQDLGALSSATAKLHAALEWDRKTHEHGTDLDLYPPLLWRRYRSAQAPSFPINHAFQNGFRDFRAQMDVDFSPPPPCQVLSQTLPNELT